MIHLPKLILASGSPRRAEILTSVGWQFEKHVADINEDMRDGETPRDYVVRLALEKADAVAKLYPGQWVVGADTTVVINDGTLGKPVDLDDARAMLRALSGNWHEVLTGIAIAKDGYACSDIQCTRVKFAHMTDDEIEYLTLHGDPLDKAGAYAIQGYASRFVTRIDGSHSNVVGLPIALVYQMLKGLTTL